MVSIFARDRFEAIAGSITCHRNEASVEKVGDKYEIDDKLAGL